MSVIFQNLYNRGQETQTSKVSVRVSYIHKKISAKKLKARNGICPQSVI